MAIITPDALNQGITDLNRDRIVSWGANVPLTGIKAEAKDIIALSPTYMKPAALFPRIVKLSVRVDGVFAANDDLVLFNGDNSATIKLTDFAAATDLEKPALQDEQVNGGDPVLIHRVWREGVRVGVLVAANMAAAIAASKSADVYLAFETNANTVATENALTVAA